MYKRSKRLYKTIEKCLEKRNSLIVPYFEDIPETQLPHFHRHLTTQDINDPARENWFWTDHTDLSTYDQDVKVLAWQKLKRYREEMAMLRREQELWCSHAKHDLAILSTPVLDQGPFNHSFQVLQSRAKEQYRSSGFGGGLIPDD